MHKNSCKHRHFLVAPIALFLTALVAAELAVQQSAPLQAFLTIANSSPAISVQTGLQLVPESDGRIATTTEIPELLYGSTYVMSEGISHMDVGSMRLMSFHGTYFVSHYDGVVSIAAISSPVLVQQGNQRVLIPVRYQWRFSKQYLKSISSSTEEWLADRTIERIPAVFMETAHRNMAKHESQVLASLPPALSEVSLFHAPSFLLLPSAKEARRIALQKDTLGVLRFYLETNNLQGMQKLLADSDAIEKLSTQHGLQMSSVMLTQAGETSVTALALSEFLTQDPDTWLLMSVHPQYRALAWIGQIPALTRERQMLTWLRLPESNILERAHGPLIMRRWKYTVSRPLSLMAAPHKLFGVLLSEWNNVVGQLDRQGYPERMLRLRNATVSLAEPYRTLLSDVEQNSIHQLEQLDRIRIPEVHAASPRPQEPEQDTPPVQDVAPESTLSLEEMQTIAESLLYNAGALITTETEFLQADSPNAVTVRKLVFSTPSTDRVFTVDYHVQEGTISNITENGRLYPNTLSLEQFVEWATE